MSVICENQIRKSHQWGSPKKMREKNGFGKIVKWWRGRCKCGAISDTVDRPKSE